GGGRSSTLRAASKAFNLPGLACAFAIVPNSELRARLSRAAAGIVPRVNAMGFEATLAAYRHGVEWRRALVHYLRANRDLLIRRIQSIPKIGITPIEATYLAWIRIDATGIRDPVAFFEHAGVGVYDGRAFGTEGYMRLNFGCPRSLLETGLDRDASALGSALG